MGENILQVVNSRDPIKVERYYVITREGLFTLVFSSSKSVYLPIPAEMRKEILQKYNVDLTKKNGIQLRCSVAEEKVGEEIDGDTFRLKIIYSLQKRRNPDLQRRKVDPWEREDK